MSPAKAGEKLNKARAAAPVENSQAAAAENKSEIGGAFEKVPRHIAVIPDGNRRWAKKRGLPAAAGHKAGVEAYKKLLSDCADRGVKYVTFYAFSTENWNRSASEVSALMALLKDYLKNLDKVLGDNIHKVRFLISGDREALGEELTALIEDAERRTAANTDLTAVIALNYGGRAEIVHGAKELARKVKKGELEPDEINEEMFARTLYADVPDPDLLIRTSGEMRLSNFLLWQLAYAEFYFCPVYWPDFGAKELDEAIAEFGARGRRFGK